MNLSFLPGDLHLTKVDTGEYVVTLQGKELLRTRVEKKAITKFNTVRKELEAQFPARELTPEQKMKALQKQIMDTKITQTRNSFKPPKKEKVRGTRTFG